MGLERITPQTIKRIPLLLGEADIIKVIQLLPGVQAASEGSSGFIVRGGSPDQNLVLFDHATVYNPSHMMGFFSIFNNDAVGDVQLYKGDIPASYGGRLSSLLDVEGREGTPDFTVSGGIGLIASRLAVSGPLGKDVTWLAAARRTYADIFLRFSGDTMVNGATINFYDLNGKMRWRVNDHNYVTFTIYNGRDRFGTRGVGFHFGNSIGSLVWNHRFSSQLSLATSLSGTMYQYEFKGIMEAIESKWAASIKESGIRNDFLYKWNDRTDIRFGWSWMYQWFRPGDAKIAFQIGDQTVDKEVNMSHRQAMLHMLYFSNEHKFFGQRLHLRYGLRLTRFDNVGPTMQYFVDENYKIKDSLRVAPGHFYHHEYGIEPRAALSYMLNDQMSVKASYSRTLQYAHLLSFSSAGSPLDVWIPANPAVKPQVAQQYAVGFFRGIAKNRLQASVELFYKDLNHVVDFKERPNLLLYDTVETELRSGRGYAYGAELMLKKESGDLSGWVSYTWLRSFRKIEGVNANKRYPAPSDRPHNISIVANYQLPFFRCLEISANWIYATGQPFEMPQARYYAFEEFIPIFSTRNAYRMPDYHRMDVSLIFHLEKPGAKLKNELNVSVYNVYGRKNPWMINYRLERDGSQYTEMTYLFSFVPSVTWNFNF
jgi:outer membrane receptor for ferrienterochelin and colicin